MIELFHGAHFGSSYFVQYINVFARLCENEGRATTLDESSKHHHSLSKYEYKYKYKYCTSEYQ